MAKRQVFRVLVIYGGVPPVPQGLRATLVKRKAARSRLLYAGVNGGSHAENRETNPHHGLVLGGQVNAINSAIFGR